VLWSKLSNRISHSLLKRGSGELKVKSSKANQEGKPKLSRTVSA